MKMLRVCIAGLALLSACTLTDDAGALPASGLYIAGGGMLSNPLFDNHCIGLTEHGATNLLYFSGVHNSIQGIRVSRQIEDTAYTVPVFIPGTLGLSNFCALSDGTHDWLAVQTPSNIVLIRPGETVLPMTGPDSKPISGLPVCLVGTNANFPGIASDTETILLIYANNGTNLSAAVFTREDLESRTSGPLVATRIETLPDSRSRVAPGGSHLRASTLGMDRDSILMARTIPNRGFEMLLSDLSGHERLLTGFSSPLDDCSPVYSVRERSLYMTSRAFAPENVMQRLNIFRWKSRGLDEQSSYESGPSARTWVLTIGTPAREDIVGLLALPDRTIIAGRTSASGSDDVFIAALDSFGGILWQKTLGTADADQPVSLLALGGNLLIVGTRTMPGTSSGFVLRLDRDGSLLDVAEASSGTVPIEFTAAVTNNAGEVLISGTLRPDGANTQAVLVRWNPADGNTFTGVTIGGATMAHQGLTLAWSSGGILVGGMAGVSPALLQVSSDLGTVTFSKAGSQGRIRVVRMTANGWLFGGTSDSSGIFGRFDATSSPSACTMLADAPLGDALPDGSLLVFERQDPSLAGLSTDTGLTDPFRSWGLTGVLEQHPRLFMAPGGSLFLTAQAQGVNANDGFIVKLDPARTLLAIKSGVFEFGKGWTALPANGPAFNPYEGESGTPSELSLTGKAGTWETRTGVSLVVRYWYR